MTAPPAVSVLMPARDAGATIGPALDSILGQTLRELELIVVDDGSRDDTEAVVRRRAAGDPRVRVLSLREPRGIVQALNTGLAAARAPLLARMDADDLADAHRLALQHRFLGDHPEIDVCDSRVEIFRDDGPVRGGFAAYQRWLDGMERHEDMARECLVENPVVHPAVMARSALLRSLGGYRDGPFPEDYDLWLRALRAGARFHKLPARLLRWRDHGRRLTRTDDRYGRRGFFTLKWRHVERTLLRPGQRVGVWGAGRAGRPWRRNLHRSAAVLAAVYDIDPAKIGRTRQGVPVLPADEVDRQPLDLLLVAVGARGARALIRERLDAAGVVEGRDAYFVA